MPYTKSGIRLPPTMERKPMAQRRRETGLHLYEGIGAVVAEDGKTILWQDPDWIQNALADEGEQDMMKVYLRGEANPSKFLALINGGTTAPVETSTMAYLGGVAGANETKVPAADGYNRQQITTAIAATLGAAGWFDEGLVAGDYRFTADEKTFGAATGTAWTITHTALVTAATGQTAGSGKFLAFLLLSATTTIAVGQSFKYVLRQSMS